MSGTRLSQPELLEQVLDYARRAGADQADALVIASEELAVNWRLGELEDLTRAESAGIGLRVFCGQRQAVVSSTQMVPETLEELAQRAVSMANVAPEDAHIGLVAPEKLAKNWRDLELADTDMLSEEVLVEQARTTEDAARAVAGVTNSEGAEAESSKTSIAMANTNGFLGSYTTTMHALSVSVLAGEGVGMERDYAYSVRRHAGELNSPEAIGKDAAERAIKRLNPRKAKSCTVPVIFDPRVSKALIGTLASCISGSAVARGTTFLKNHLNQQVFASGIRIMDDPTRVGGLASRPFDAEGVAGIARAVVEDGVLTTWLLDRRSAHKLGMETTGHASRGLASPPSPSSTNFYLENGEKTPTELIADLKDGFYVTDLMGMGVNQVTGDYSQGASGFWIENGKLSYPVSEVTIAGHLLDMFRTLTPADDLAFDFRVNAPTVRIDAMTVAGA